MEKKIKIGLICLFVGIFLVGIYLIPQSKKYELWYSIKYPKYLSNAAYCESDKDCNLGFSCDACTNFVHRKLQAITLSESGIVLNLQQCHVFYQCKCENHVCIPIPKPE